MVGRIASNAYSARSYPDGRVLIPREVGQPDDETTLVFDLSIALHYSRYEISGVDELWVSSPHVSEDDVLSVTALALDSHSFVPPSGDAANSVTVEHKTFQDYLATQGVRMTNSALTYLVRRTADAGGGGQSLAARHTAGMNAVLTTCGLRAVVSELQPQYPGPRRVDPHVAGVSRCGPVAVAGRAREGGVLIAGLIGDLVGQALELALGHRVCGDLSGGLHVARRDHTALDVDGDGHLTVRSGGLGTHAVSNFRSWTVNPQCMGRTGHGA